MAGVTRMSFETSRVGVKPRATNARVVGRTASANTGDWPIVVNDAVSGTTRMLALMETASANDCETRDRVPGVTVKASEGANVALCNVAVAGMV